MNGGESGAGEVLRTLGLLLNLAAIVAFALFLSTLGTAGPGTSGMAAVAIVAFLASLLCFVADRRRSEAEMVPVTAAATISHEL